MPVVLMPVAGVCYSFSGLTLPCALSTPVLARLVARFQVMLTYFRVLKRRPPPPALFPAVMEGLAKFVHLVNLDTVQDLLDLLKDLLTEVRARHQRIA